MKPFQVVIVIVASAAIATLGLLHGGGADVPEAQATHPLDDHFDPLMPRYPRVAELPLGERLEAGDGAMRMSHFSTTDSPLRVARYYQTVWEQEGLSVHHDVSPSGGVVGTFDPRAKMARSVTILAHGGRTWVFPATVERPLDVARAGDMGEDDGLPVFPGSSKGLTLRTSDAGQGTSLVATYTNSGGLTKNVEFYRREMQSRGWNESEVPSFEELGSDRMLTFQRGDQRCDIDLTSVGEEDQVIVCVVLEGRDAR